MDETSGIECFECGHVSEGDWLSDFDECENCESDNTQTVRIIPCPNGITASDWIPMVGMKPGRNCDSEFHDPKTGKHIERHES